MPSKLEQYNVCICSHDKTDHGIDRDVNDAFYQYCFPEDLYALCNCREFTPDKLKFLEDKYLLQK